MHTKLLPFAAPEVDRSAFPTAPAKERPVAPLRIDAPIASGAAAVPARQALVGKLEELSASRPRSLSFAILSGLDAAFELHAGPLSGGAREELRRMTFERLVEAPMIFIDTARAADRPQPMSLFDEAVRGPRPSAPPPLPVIATRAELLQALEQAERQPDPSYRALQTLVAAAGYLKTSLKPAAQELGFAGQQFWGDHTKLSLYPLQLNRIEAAKPEFMNAVSFAREQQREEAQALVLRQPRSSLEAEDWAWAVQRMPMLPLESPALNRSLERAAEVIDPARTPNAEQLVDKAAHAVFALESWSIIRKAPPAERTEAALAAIAELPTGALPAGAHTLLSQASRRASENLLRASGRADQEYSVHFVQTPPGDLKDAARALLSVADRTKSLAKQAVIAPFGQGVLVAFPGQDLATVERTYSGKPEAIVQPALIASRLNRALAACAGHQAVAKTSERPGRSGAQVIEDFTAHFGAIDLSDPELMRALMHPSEIKDVVSELYAREQKAGREPGLVLDALIEGLDAGHARRGTQEQWTAAIDRAPFVNDLRDRRIAGAISLAANHSESVDLGSLIRRTQEVLGLSSPAERSRFDDALSDLLKRHRASSLFDQDPVLAKTRLVALVTPLAS